MINLVSSYSRQKHHDSIVPTRLNREGLDDDVDPDSIVLFDDIKWLVEIVLEATNEQQIGKTVV